MHFSMVHIRLCVYSFLHTGDSVVHLFNNLNQSCMFRCSFLVKMLISVAFFPISLLQINKRLFPQSVPVQKMVDKNTTRKPFRKCLDINSTVSYLWIPARI